MDKQIVSVSLAFENSEYLTIGFEHIEDIRCHDVHLEISACGDYLECEGMTLNLLPSADHLDFHNDAANIWFHASLFDRLRTTKDLMAVTFTYDDGEEREIFLPWGDDEQHNEYQHDMITQHGRHLVILVGDTQYIDNNENAENYLDVMRYGQKPCHCCQ